MGSTRARDRHYALQRWWAHAIFDGAAGIFGFRVDVAGEDVVGHGPLLVLMRHASVADTPLPVVLLSVRHGLRMRYVLKRELLWDPCLDLVGHRIPNVFVRRGSDDGAREVAQVTKLARGLGRRDGILIYPEGTRFTPQKLVRARAAIAERGDAARVARVGALRHVLPPRLGGALALLGAAPDADVLIVAHTGFEAVGSFNDLWNGGLVGCHVRVQLWRVPRADIPDAPDGQAAWIDAQWARIDAWLDAQQGRSA
jgi:1-acyl-sn-glycerol-3-phosphate acyltransferase